MLLELDFDKVDLTKYNKEEVCDVRIVNVDNPNLQLRHLSSLEFTPWFWQCFQKARRHLNAGH